MRRVIVHIDRLVLRGFSRAERHAIAQGLRAELGVLLAEPLASAALTSQGDRDRILVGRVRVGASAGSAGVGARAARAITKRVRP